ncbi:acylphosphatase [Halobacillus litoralis]|uniref:acylphosphatase n=1 Tax=Halobacillus litoralis TaxID=45668 RepID=UPI001CD1CDB3|nr:acylphosphatase [Halobacillus litoralis]MCA0968974.1 acylphosphatase [Halobacillus litoralis]
MERRHYIVHGRVQGVGFRATIQQTAKQLDLVGWVKNKPDGTVELEAQGEQEKLDDLQHELEKGPTPFASVRHLDVSTVAIEKEEKKFRVIH